MRLTLPRLATVAMALVLAPAAQADLTLLISGESADLTQLSVGQTVRFDVSLSGLANGDALDYLAGTVKFDAALLGTAFSIAQGAIVPDPDGFVGQGFPGLADAFYDAVNFSSTHTPITSNGVFFSFEVTALQPGSGSLAFDISSLAAADGTNTPVPLGAGPELPFTIRSVPEPSTFLLAMSGAIGCGGFLLARRTGRRPIERA